MYKILPHHKYFATQGDDEEVLIIARRHWIVYIPAFLMVGFLYLASFYFLFNLNHLPLIKDSPTLQALGVVFFSLLLLFATLGAYISWLVNYLNVQIVTNEHVVDIDQLGLFHRKISELTLDNIEDVAASQKGIIQSFLHYGDITIQTAGELPNFTFEKVSDPYGIGRQIMDIKDKYMDSIEGGKGSKETKVI